jgi:hypothetical protein
MERKGMLRDKYEEYMCTVFASCDGADGFGAEKGFFMFFHRLYHCSKGTRAVLLLLAAFCCRPETAAAGLFRDREYRSINTPRYEISIRKNGRTDVKFASGAPVFENAAPRIQFAEKDDRIVPISAADSSRVEVHDRLGQGHGLVFECREGEWHINTYPTQPFFTVRFVYINRGRKPVQIEKLIPWSVSGVAGALHMGADADQTRILENGRLFQTFNDYAAVVRNASRSQWNLAAFNPASRRTLAAGFLTFRHAYSQVVMEREADDKKNQFPVFRAECVYDPPVTVPPEGRIVSETLYLGIAETAPHTGLERYGKAVAIANGVRNERALIPHGWDSWSTKYHRDINEEIILENLDFVAAHLTRYGWTHFAVDAGWEKGLAEWEADPAKFPRGMKYIADAIHDRGMTAGLWVDPFTVPRESQLAKEHPEWMAEPHALGRVVMGPGKLILDVTIPEAYAWARDLAAKIRHDWGFDALVEADFVYHLLLAEKYNADNVTRIDVQHMGMNALREGFGEGFIMAMTPQPVNALHADGIRVGRDCAPVWRSGNINAAWGCVETLTNVIRRYYFSPHLYVPDQDCAFFPRAAGRERWQTRNAPALTQSQSTAWLTGAALSGGAVKIGTAFADLTKTECAILQKLLPSPGIPATPIDLFQEAPPQIWWLPLETEAGKWYVLALFNWNEEESAALTVPFASLGLEPDRYYTVFDFWAETYGGVARNQLRAEVAPAGVRLFGLRPWRETPMLLSSSRHFTQGALDHNALRWDADARELRGTFSAVENTAYTLQVLAPDPWRMQSARLSSGDVCAAQDGEVIRLEFQTEMGGEYTWTVAF